MVTDQNIRKQIKAFLQHMHKHSIECQVAGGVICTGFVSDSKLTPTFVGLGARAQKEAQVTLCLNILKL